jgi:hypothetical protein
LQEPDQQASGKVDLLAGLKEFAEKLPKDDGPFYAGKKFGFVDIELAPWVLRFVHTGYGGLIKDSIFWRDIVGLRFRLRMAMPFGKGFVNGLMLLKNVIAFGKLGPRIVTMTRYFFSMNSTTNHRFTLDISTMYGSS